MKEVNSSNGFTLHELLFVIIILGILASLAFPRLSKSFEAARAEEARVALRQIYSAERIFRSGTEHFYPHSSTHPGAATAAEIFDNLRVQLDEGIDWNYSLDTNTADDFTASATRTAGRNAGETLSIDQTGTLNEAGWTP